MDFYKNCLILSFDYGMIDIKFLKIEKMFRGNSHESFDERHVCFEHRGTIVFQSSFTYRSDDFIIVAINGKNEYRAMDLHRLDSFGSNHRICFDDPFYSGFDGWLRTIGKRAK